MYSPYGTVAANQQQQPRQQQKQPQFQTGNLQHPQPQHASFQQQGHQQAGPYSMFFQDPTSSMAAQFARTGLGTSNQYIQQNFGSLIPGTQDLSKYFKVSNSYVLSKIRLILFPYRNKTWNRILAEGSGEGANESYSLPVDDVNAPDLYIPLMSYVTYILLWAAFQGLKGDFHPQLFGYLASQTLACSVLDVMIFKMGLYLLNCDTQSTLWDLVAFSGYRNVTIVTLLVCKNVIGTGWVYYLLVFALTTSLSLFLMRSLRSFVLGGPTVGSASNSITGKQRKMRIQFLFVYAVVVQFIIVLFMSM